MPRRPPTAPTTPFDAAKALAKYAAWLKRQPLAERTADAYRAQVGTYLTWLAASDYAGEALSSEAVRDWAVRDYKRAMKKRRLKPTTVNQGLAAIDSLYRSLNLGRPDVRREALAQVAPRA